MGNRMILTSGALVAALSVIAVTASCFAATLTAGQNSAIPTQSAVSVPISLTSGTGEQVAAIQFDILFDYAILTLTDVAAGPATTSAGKDISFSTLEPGRGRAIIAGLNQNVISNGTIAITLFNVSRDAPGGDQSVSLSGVLLSDPNGVAVPSESVSGHISIAAIVPAGANGTRGVLLVCAVFVAVALIFGGARLWCTGCSNGKGKG